MHDLVITAGTAVGSVLALAEAIKKDIQCKVYVLCTDKKTTSIIASSRFVDEATLIDSQKNGGYVQSIKNWYQTKNFMKVPVLYSTTDTSCFLINKEREWFEKHFKLSLPSSEIIETYTQKGLAEIAASKAGLVVPKTRILTKETNVEIELADFNFPVILKPRATYLKGEVDFKIKVIDDIDNLKSEVKKYLQQGDELLCQEYIEGDSKSAYYYIFYRNNLGEVFSSMGIKTLQSTPKGGIMLKGLSKYDPELDKKCREFLSCINYQGIGGIEFKKSKDILYFIEMSVRLEGFYKLAEASNVPLSLISYCDLTKFKKAGFFKQKDGVVYISWTQTLLNHFKNKKILAFLKDLILSILHPKYRLDVFSIYSPAPFFKGVFLTVFGKSK